ncbi:MAG: MarR family winged helix-turn-helix transcriptional regulator [Clostridia bacterium]
MTKKQLLMKLLKIIDDIKPNPERTPLTTNSFDQNFYNLEKDIKIPPTARTLLVFLLDETNTNQRALAKYLGITAQGISDVLTKLEQQGLVSRQRGEVYNENYIILTEKGKLYALDFDTKVNEHSENLFKNFSEQDVSNFHDLLSKLSIGM